MLAALTKTCVRPLIELNDQINKLTTHEKEINSTRIVVLGDQSHGKSSLLEALSGVDLPRGEDIKTRVPLVMKLRRCQESEKECAIISRDGVPSVNITLQQVASMVDEFTAAIAGDGKVRRRIVCCDRQSRSCFELGVQVRRRSRTSVSP